MVDGAIIVSNDSDLALPIKVARSKVHPSASLGGVDNYASVGQGLVQHGAADGAPLADVVLPEDAPQLAADCASYAFEGWRLLDEVLAELVLPTTLPFRLSCDEPIRDSVGVDAALSSFAFE